MLSKRIIACLDVKAGKVIKGVKFRQHQVVGDIVDLAQRYSDQGVDELVFYDITASSDNRRVDDVWVQHVARRINIPFCVAGGISTVADAEAILQAGADKISINSPAIEQPDRINALSQRFGRQCVVVGIDSLYQDGDYYVYQYTGDASKTKKTWQTTKAWMQEVQQRGAGEIVLNCMAQDGMRQGYDIKQLRIMQRQMTIPIVASGGAGSIDDFVNLFQQTNVSGALAASVFHNNLIDIAELKNDLRQHHIEVRQ